MKKMLILFFVSILLQNVSFAQIEFKTNVLGAILERPYFGVEYSLTDDFSVEVGAGAIFGKTINDRPQSGANLLLAGKYYFNTRWGMDRYFAGFYVRPKNHIIKNHEADNFDNASRRSGVGTGVILGRKWASEIVSFEISMGLGKLFGDNIYLYNNPTNAVLFDTDIDAFFNINFGYRL